MNNDKKMFKWLGLLILAPLLLAIFGGDRFRYPCQDPDNWDKDICKKPACDVRRECPEHIFKGQTDPRTGMDTAPATPKPAPSPTTGVCK